jgi:hypothetical protein
MSPADTINQGRGGESGRLEETFSRHAARLSRLHTGQGPAGPGRVWIVFDKVTVAYRGAKYEIGRGRDFYGIWTAGGSRAEPVERWPETPDGWSAAWARFTEIEEPGTIGPAGRTAGRTAGGTGAPGAAGTAAQGAAGRLLSPGAGGAAAAALLAVGVALGVAGLFPSYFTGTSLAAEPPQLVPHAIYLAAWAASAALIVSGGARLRAGALLGAGTSIVTLGLFIADAGTQGADLAGAGMWLSLAGWLACAAGSALAFGLRPAGPLAADASDQGGTAPGWRGRLGVPRGSALGPAILLVLAGLGTAVAFAPAWDSYTLRTAAGQTQYVTAGNAFSNPGPVIAGDVIVMVALVVAVIAAAGWRPVRLGAVLLAGAVIPVAAQAISALIQVGEATPPQQFGLTPAQAAQLGLTIENGLTPTFWIYCVFLITLAVSCLWMLFTPRTPQPAAPQPATLGPATSGPAAPGWRPAGGLPGGAAARDPAAERDPAGDSDSYGWNPVWYAATPDATGVSSARAPLPGDADTENDQAG